MSEQFRITHFYCVKFLASKTKSVKYLKNFMSDATVIRQELDCSWGRWWTWSWTSSPNGNRSAHYNKEGRILQFSIPLYISVQMAGACKITVLSNFTKNFTHKKTTWWVHAWTFEQTSSRGETQTCFLFFIIFYKIFGMINGKESFEWER